MLLVPYPISAQPEPGATYVLRSQSGQFIIHAGQIAVPFAPAFDQGTDTNFVRLDAARLTVASERIKQALWRNLAANAPWRSKIHLYLHPANGSDETITITSEQFTDSWQYGVYLPDVVERERFTRSIVQVLLLEMANRNAGARGAEIPLWLTEGLTQQLLAEKEAALIPPPPHRGVKSFDRLEVTRTMVDIRTNQPLAQAHRQLRAEQTLTFEELSWPTEDRLSGKSGEVFRSSAQLFVAELSRLRDGRACLRATVEELPSYLNWQFAFLRGFQAWFQSPLDVEKWWALRVVRFTDRDLAHNWPIEESLKKLEEALLSPIQVRTGPTELPLRGEATLQTVIREWDTARQTQTLRSKVAELDFVRLRVNGDLAALVDEYRQTIAAYLQNPIKTPALLALGEKTGQSHIARDTLKRLDALDARREALRRALEPVATAQNQPPTVSAP